MASHRFTVALQVAIQSGAGPFCTDTFKVSFYVPSYLHGDVPKPDSKDLFVETTPKQTVYISSYGGYALDGKAKWMWKSFIVSCFLGVHCFWTTVLISHAFCIEIHAVSCFHVGVVVYKAKAAIAGLKDLDITVDEANIQTAGCDSCVVKIVRIRHSS